MSGMQRNDRRARRILSLFEHLHQLEAGRLSRLEAHARELELEEQRLIFHLDGDGVLATIFSDLVLNKLRSTIQQRDVAALAVEKQAKLTLEHAKRVKQSERLVVEAERDRSLQLWQSELGEIIDRALKVADIRSP
jgi:hypothetical protein